MLFFCSTTALSLSLIFFEYLDVPFFLLVFITYYLLYCDIAVCIVGECALVCVIYVIYRGYNNYIGVYIIHLYTYVSV